MLLHSYLALVKHLKITPSVYKGCILFRILVLNRSPSSKDDMNDICKCTLSLNTIVPFKDYSCYSIVPPPQCISLFVLNIETLVYDMVFWLNFIVFLEKTPLPVQSETVTGHLRSQIVYMAVFILV